MPAIHHLNCATMCPAGATRLGLVDGDPGHIVAHCLLIEDPSGLILVDTGFGTADIERHARVGPARFLFSPRFVRSETAVAQVRSLGYDPADVRHVLITHLDLDHAGGLSDFPNAQIHLHNVELETITRAALPTRLRYRYDQWSHGPIWAPHAEAGESWFGFERVRLIEGLDTEIAMIPLFGHTAGHSGYAIRNGERWMLHAGDAYLRQIEVAAPASAPGALSVYHWLNSVDRAARRENASRLIDLHARHSDVVTMFCAHDPTELHREQTRE